jgi:hypothetical protein
MYICMYKHRFDILNYNIWIYKFNFKTCDLRLRITKNVATNLNFASILHRFKFLNQQNKILKNANSKSGRLKIVDYSRFARILDERRKG